MEKNEEMQDQAEEQQIEEPVAQQEEMKGGEKGQTGEPDLQSFM